MIRSSLSSWYESNEMAVYVSHRLAAPITPMGLVRQETICPLLLSCDGLSICLDRCRLIDPFLIAWVAAGTLGKDDRLKSFMHTHSFGCVSEGLCNGLYNTYVVIVQENL